VLDLCPFSLIIAYENDSSQNKYRISIIVHKGPSGGQS